MRWQADKCVALLLLSAAPTFGASTSIVLPAEATTSAGIFDAQDRLVRTLWSGRKFAAGRVALDWDGRDDDGAALPAAGQYVARVLAHNVHYVWEGVIGNTSEDQVGSTLHRALNPVHDMAFDSAGNAFYVVGYNERQSSLHRFRATSPQRQVNLAHDDYRRAFRYVATDGTLAYFANVGVVAKRGSFAREPASFVVALRVLDGVEHKFSFGRDVMAGSPGNHWLSAIDYDQTDIDFASGFRDAPSGIAVQQRGQLLFVAHSQLNEVRVFDKRDGRLLHRIAVVAPGDLDVAPDDSLWVLSGPPKGRLIAHLAFRQGEWQRVEEIREGLSEPVAIGVSPQDGIVVVADAGTEQLKAYDAHGSPLWNLGQAGGYRRGGPGIVGDRFWLSQGPTYVAFQRDGSFWVGDPGNVRNLHFSASRQFIDQIMYLPRSYVATVDTADPTRVFCHFLEFEVDYSKPLQRSWRLVRNWASGLSAIYRGEFDGFQTVHTLANGRTYGAIRRYDADNGELVELTEGGLRPTGVVLGLGTRLYPDGSLRFQKMNFRTLNFYQRSLAGFDDRGNPRWDSPELLARVRNVRDADPFYHDVPLIYGMNESVIPITKSGIVVSFNPGKSEGFHLGGLRRGTDVWQWRASPSGSWNLDNAGNLIMPTGTFEMGRGVQYPASVVMISGSQIVYGYHGEAWNGGQANQWIHYLDNGLFVGQFGRPVYVQSNITGALPETAGNAISPQLIEVGGKVYLWHNDEAVHGGVHRWRLDGLDSIKLLEAPLQP